MRRFRFGLQASGHDPVDVVQRAVEAEAAGFDVFQVGDHVGAEPAALVALTAAAAATRTIRLGTLVLNNDLHHPVTLAQQVATLDHVSGGRMELGLGAGHSFPEYAAMGRPFDPPAVRKARLAESVEILRALLDTGSVTYRGHHYRISEATTLRPLQSHLPMLVGVNGREALAHAARHADIVAPTMLGPTLQDGQRHEVRWEAARLDATVAHLRDRAGDRWPALELHALVQALVLTDDREHAAVTMAERTRMKTSDVLATPFLCLGTHAEMARHLLDCRARWGISYFSVRDIGSFAPVMALVREAEESP